jgi:acetyl-CoA carboxylase biotin carboxylase subunit
VSALPFKRILIANRGEIAVRLIRACHELGIEAVAVYSDVDRTALHVRYADHAIALEGNEPAATYLNQDKLIAAAKRGGAEAVHPGYGFLSENANFVRRCLAEGLVFIGPNADVMESMGDKIRARSVMALAGVPVIPGRDAVTRGNLLSSARDLGYPLMLKASAGGGGKGIRAVHSESELLSAFERAEGEARTAFGDGTIYMEKLLVGPHHIEIQIFGDQHGQAVHLFERECSVQRRHQKVIEETPSPFLTPELRKSMGEAAVAAALAMGYTGAGTVEFLVDQDRNFYFLEVNARLQVEHPVTELVTGIDLVREQIRVAAGLPLSFSQSDVEQHGHAIEVRICAEDPENGFLPSVGDVTALTLPGGPGVRLDSSLYPGLKISLFYDSLLAKLAVWGRDREEALARLRQALSELRIADLKCNVAWLARALRTEEFRSGHYDTGMVARMGSVRPSDAVFDAAAIAAALVAHRRASQATRSDAGAATQGLDPWKAFGRRTQMRSSP